jgi:hypothetical protein
VSNPPRFEISWNAEQVAEWTKEMFPEVTRYLRKVIAQRKSKEADCDNDEGQQLWVLLRKDNRSLSVVKSGHAPDGWDIWQSWTKGRSTNDEVIIYIGNSLTVSSHCR